MNSPQQLSPQPRALALNRVCIAVAAETSAELIANSARLLREFPFQEFRLDYLHDTAASVSSLRAHTAAHPEATFLATCRRQASGGNFRGSPHDELTILLQAVSAGFALTDLSLETAEILGQGAVEQLRAAGATVILSWHDFHRTGDLDLILDRMRPFAPDIGKIVPTAKSLRDNLPLFRLLHRSENDVPFRTVGLSMGEAGVPSRVLGVQAGSAFTFAAGDDEQATAPGQISGTRLRSLYRIEQIDRETQRFGVAGDPIRSSLSPLMLNAAFAHAGKNAVYVPLLTRDAEELFQFARELNLRGFSITMPLKQAVLPLLDHVDPLAAGIGAVNTVRLTPDGRFEGFNTDAAGIVTPLQARLPLRGARVLVLGAGGAARAAVFGCAHRGALVFILSRRPEQAAQLASEAGAQAIGRAQLPRLAPFDVLINTTPAGMKGNATQLPLEPEELRAGLVFDLVYNPLETPLIEAARARGIDTVLGIEMFVHQGARQFELWMGEPAPVDLMRQVVSQALATR